MVTASKYKKTVSTVKGVIKRIKEYPSPFSTDLPPENSKKKVVVRSKKDRLQEKRSQRLADYKATIREITLISSTIALGAKLAVIDGDINRDEIESFKKVFPKADHPQIELGKFFGKACNDDISFEHYAKKVTSYFPNQEQLYKDLLTSLFEFGAIDGPLNVEEITFLQKVSQIFGLDEEHFYDNIRKNILPRSRNPFVVLGIAENATVPEIKKAYRDTAQAYHPDRMATLSCAEKIIEIANERFNAIQKAYSQIKALRNIG